MFRYYNELHKQFEKPSVTHIIKKIVQCAGHVEHIDEKRIPKRVLKSNITGRRPVGQQRKPRLMQWK
jgi:hypothetical protein